MKVILYTIVFSVFFLKCRWSTDPTPRPSPSIEYSKKDGVFLNEYQPQAAYLKIEGKDYKIKEVWAEHTHLERTEGHIPGKGYDFVMTFDSHPNDNINFNQYTKDLDLGSQRIWFFLREQEYSKDTLVLYYREKLDYKEQKTFLLFKKR